MYNSISLEKDEEIEAFLQREYYPNIENEITYHISEVKSDVDLKSEILSVKNAKTVNELKIVIESLIKHLKIDQG